MTPAAGILVARLDNVGDVLLAGPAVRAAAATGRPVHLLCGPRGRAAADLLPGVAEVVEWRAPWIDPDPMPVDPADAARLVAAVGERGIADALILGSSHQSPLPLALLLRHARVDRIAAVSHDHAGSLLDVRIKGDPDVHEVERNLMVADALGFPRPADDRLRVSLGELGEKRYSPHTSGSTGPYVVVHPGASVPARTLSPERWSDITEALVSAGWTVVVTGSTEEVGLAAAVVGDHPGVWNVAGRTTLRELGQLLATAAAFVGGNTGPLHLAAAVGTPCVTAFAPTVPLRRWQPWRVPFVALGDQSVPCAGCRSRECPLSVQACLQGVQAEGVVQAVLEVIEERTPMTTSSMTPTPP